MTHLETVTHPNGQSGTAAPRFRTDDLELSREIQQQILRDRTQSLAQLSDTNDHDDIQIIEFLLHQQPYAFELTYVKEVYSVSQIAPIPCTPPFVAGVINIRGQIVSVVVLTQLFNLPTDSKTTSGKVIILHTDNMEFGVLVDQIQNVQHISANDIQPTPSAITGRRAKYLKGVTSTHVAILDAAKLLHDPHLIIQEEITE